MTGSVIGRDPVGRDHLDGRRRRRTLFLGVLACAVAVLTTSLLVARLSGVAVDGRALLLACGAFTLALVLRIRLRVGATYVLLAWGEASLLVALCLLPPVWVPIATASGALVAYVDRIPAVIAGRRLRLLFPIIVVTVASAASVDTVVAVTGDAAEPVRVDPAGLSGLVAVLLAGLVFALVTSVLVAAWAAQDRSLVAAWRQIMRGKRMMVVGNIAFGFAVAVIIGWQPWWLLALAPIVVLLHIGYRNQARGVEQRETWAVLAQATRSLNYLDEEGVVRAAERGAVVLFGAAAAEVRLRERREPTSFVAPALRPADPAGAAPATLDADPARVVSRALVMGSERLGDLRLVFSRPTILEPAMQLVLAAFADAVAGALHDATVHRRLRVMTARSAFDSAHDPLTGLANRAMVIALGDAELGRRTAGSPVALVLLDVDEFRTVNDALGHAAGDELLTTLGRRLRGALRPGELLGCLGGDEFAVLLADDRLDPSVRAEQITDLAGLPVEVAGVTIAVAATAGVGLGAAGRADLTELLRRADLALRRARREGSRIARSDTAYAGPGQNRPTLLAELREALTSGSTEQLQLMLQPVVDLTTTAPVGVEALVRWHHPRRGLLLPADFIDLVEQSELAGAFTRHVLDLALGVVSAWSGEGIDLPVSVNICARVTLDPTLPDLVANRLEVHDVTPARLILEVTEGVTAADLDHAEVAIAALRATGVQVSVGDFGATLASLQFLARCRVDEVKIGPDFVAAMGTSPQTSAIVSTTVDLGRELELRVVATGVERPEQRDALAALGVVVAQGYLFYPPMPPDQASAVVQGLATAASAGRRTIGLGSAPRTATPPQ
jgi:diguanylate cyclase (GGDEF)-like protein